MSPQVPGSLGGRVRPQLRIAPERGAPETAGQAPGQLGSCPYPGLRRLRSGRATALPTGQLPPPQQEV